MQVCSLLFAKPEKRVPCLLCVTGLLVLLTWGVSGCGSGTTLANAIAEPASPVASASGPQLGYMWLESDRTLRPILGLPGASQIGQSVTPAGVYLNAATSASAGLALIQAVDGSFEVMHLPGGTPLSLGLSLPPGARLRLSPGGTAALLYTPGAASAWLVTGLPSAPLTKEVVVEQPIVDAAVSDTGTAAIEFVQGTSASIAITPLAGRSTQIAAGHPGGGIAFVPGRDDLLFADPVSNSVTLVRNVSTAPSSLLVPASGLLKRPSAIGISPSGRWGVVANAETQTVVRVDLASFAAVAVPCACKPTLSEALADDGAFRITALDSAANWLIDAGTANPKAMFIPALRNSSKTSVIASAVRP